MESNSESINKQPKPMPKRVPLKEEINTSRSCKKQLSDEKIKKKETHERSVY